MSDQKHSYLVKRNVTNSNDDNEGIVHYAGEVLSDWELKDHIKQKIKDGQSWYVQNYEILTPKEAELYRKKATEAVGRRTDSEGQFVDPPWDDYIGLHPKDVVDRMKELSYTDVEKVRQYERAGLNRPTIMDYVAPSEKEPWYEYNNWGAREILEKMELLDPQTVQDVIVYELNHKKRPAILTFEAEPDGDVEAPYHNGEKEMATIVSGSEDSQD